jgi:tetratricopeptide (TPR) repeat protein
MHPIWTPRAVLHALSMHAARLVCPSGGAILGPVLTLLILWGVQANVAAAPARDSKSNGWRTAIVQVYAYGPTGPSTGQANGFFVSDSGDVVTVRSVLEDAVKAKVFLGDGRELQVAGVVSENRSANLVRLSVRGLRDRVRPLRIRATGPKEGENATVVGRFFPNVLEEYAFRVSKLGSRSGVAQILPVPEFLAPYGAGSPVLGSDGAVIGIVGDLLTDGKTFDNAVSSTAVARMTRPPTPAIDSVAKRGRWLAPVTVAELWEWAHRLAGIKDLFKHERVLEELGRRTPKDARVPFELGQHYEASDSDALALEQYERACRLAPDNPEYLKRLGVVQMRQERAPEAVATFKRAAALSSKDAEITRYLMAASFLAGDWEIAKSTSEDLLKSTPDDAAALRALGASHLYGTKNYKQARDLLERLARLDSAVAVDRVLLAAAYMELEEYTRAIPVLSAVIRERPRLGIAHHVLAQTYERQSRYEEAAKAYRTAAEINPDFHDATVGEGRCLYLLGRYRQAIAALSLIASWEDPDCLVYLGRCYLRLGNREAALKQYQRLKKKDSAKAEQLLKDITSR